MRKNAKSQDFGKWFRLFVDSYPEIKKKAIAARAGISAVSFSRILSGEHGVVSSTAESLMNALNGLVGSNVVNVDEGLKIMTGTIDEHESMAQKIKLSFAESKLIIEFDIEDYSWLAQLIEMRILWKRSQNLSNQNVKSETFDSYTPPDDDETVQEPAALTFQQLSEKNLINKSTSDKKTVIRKS